MLFRKRTQTALFFQCDPILQRDIESALKAVSISYRVLPVDGDRLVDILSVLPDILLLDIDNLSGERNGVEWFTKLRSYPDLAHTKILAFSRTGPHEIREHAFALGVDEFLTKPIDVNTLKVALELLDRFEPAFWGIRGTLPIPGPTTLRYGGNTSCLSLSIGYSRQFIFDAGTGLRTFSNWIMETTGGRFDGRLFISHPHWDHFNSLPFFQPLYRPGNHIVIHGPPQGNRSLRALIDDQMDGIFFPITVEEFKAQTEYRDIYEGVHYFDGVRVTAKRLQHPGHCLAYRVDHRGYSLAYVTDNELGRWKVDHPAFQDLRDFLKGVDVLVHDCTYFDDEYPKRINWGHSSVGQATRLAHEAGVSHFYLFHHDPDHNDNDVDRKLEIAEQQLAKLGSTTRCHIAVEGKSIRVDLVSTR